MKIIGLCSDLFFKAKIRTLINHTNHELIFVNSVKELKSEIDKESCKLIVDLNFKKFDIFNELNKLDSDVQIISFFSHVDINLKNNAKSFSSVIYPRSVFFEKFLEIINE